MKLTHTALPFAVAALLAPAVATPAMAASPDLSDPSTVLSDNFSQFLDRSDESGKVSDSPAARSTSSSAASLNIDPAIGDVPDFQVDVPSTQNSGQKDGYTVLTDAESQSAQYVRADEAGATVITAASNSESVNGLSFDLGDGVKTAAKTDSDTPFVFLDNGEQVVLRTPTVKDATGRSIPANYSIEGNTVKVEVDQSQQDEIAYPLVAAAGFEYLLDYSIQTTGPYKAQQEMHKDGQFTEIFPVPGAPNNFPEKGDLLPLKMPFDGVGLSFECRMNNEVSLGDGAGYSWGFDFLATKNHIDGAGSSIRFEIANYEGDNNALYVHSVIKNSNPAGMPQSVYKAGATLMWQKFSENLLALSR